MSSGEDEKKEGDEKEGGVIDFEDPEDEKLDVRMQKSPEDPPQEGVEEHWASGHIQFRTWCPHCVKCRAKSDPHRKTKGKETKRIPTIGHDYGFMGKGRRGRHATTGLQR